MYESENNLMPRGQVRTVSRADLVRSAKLLGSSYHFEDDSPDDNEALLRGRFETLSLRPGLILHAAAVEDLRDLRTANTLHPGLKIVVVVGGCTDISFGHRHFHLGPNSPASDLRQRGILVNLNETELFSRRWQSHRKEQKISLTLTEEWLNHGGYESLRSYRHLESFTAKHLASRTWPINSRTRELAQRILAPSAYAPGLQRLQLESHCIELAFEALSDMDSYSPPPVRANDSRLGKRLDELLHSDEALGLSSAEIARRVGSNPTTLQQLVRRTWGCSLFERIRSIRMELAYTLLQGGGSVTEAAALAGYTSPPNFSTAFRQHFGTPPSQIKKS